MSERELQSIVEAATREAKLRNHEHVCAEHLLYALLEDDSVAKIIRDCGGSVVVLKKQLEDFFIARLGKVDTEAADSADHGPLFAQTP